MFDLIDVLQFSISKCWFYDNMWESCGLSCCKWNICKYFLFIIKLITKYVSQIYKTTTAVTNSRQNNPDNLKLQPNNLKLDELR